MTKPAILLLGLAVAAPATGQEPAPTPAGERVVVPSLPDQKNKEGVVSPSGGMKTDNEGWVRNNPASVEPKTGAAAPPGGKSTSSAVPAPGPGIVAEPPPPPPEGPKGKTVVDTAYLTVRGTVKRLERGVSITVTEANGRDRTIPLAAKASVYEGLAEGDKVVVRVPLKKPADGKSADRVERQKPPKAPPPSKFSQAQTTKS